MSKEKIAGRQVCAGQVPHFSRKGTGRIQESLERGQTCTSVWAELSGAALWLQGVRAGPLLCGRRDVR